VSGVPDGTSPRKYGNVRLCRLDRPCPEDRLAAAPAAEPAIPRPVAAVVGVDEMDRLELRTAQLGGDARAACRPDWSSMRLPPGSVRSPPTPANCLRPGLALLGRGDRTRHAPVDRGDHVRPAARQGRRRIGHQRPGSRARRRLRRRTARQPHAGPLQDCRDGRPPYVGPGRLARGSPRRSRSRALPPPSRKPERLSPQGSTSPWVSGRPACWRPPWSWHGRCRAMVQDRPLHPTAHRPHPPKRGPRPPASPLYDLAARSR
jgi:hypothetical protein